MNPQRTAILTGANGFIGSHLSRLLLKRGWTVHALGRSKDGVSWSDRLLRTMKEAVPDETIINRDRLHCHEADISRPDLGLFGTLPFANAFRAVLVNLAANTRFVPLDPAAQRRANMDNALNVIHALRPSLARVVHVSTAYVAGNRSGLILETETNCGQGFHNNYEKTKLEAEVAVSALCKNLNLPLTIARPSIIINDITRGRSSAFTHLNVLVEVANRIQEYYGIGDGEVVNREIRMPVNPAARPNTAPVDPIMESLALIMESADAYGKNFHLCHPSPQSNGEVFDLVMSAFGIKGKIKLNFVEQMLKPLTRTEEMVVRAFRVYLPYLNQTAVFDCSNTRAIIAHYDTMFPPVTIDYLHKVIAFERASRKQNAAPNNPSIQ